MDQAAFEKLVLDLSIVLTAAGGMLVVAFAIDGARRYAASALIGIVAAILMTPKARHSTTSSVLSRSASWPA